MTQRTTSGPTIEAETIHRAIQEEYQVVAENPNQGFHFHTGRPLTKMLGYDVRH